MKEIDPVGLELVISERMRRAELVFEKIGGTPHGRHVDVMFAADRGKNVSLDQVNKRKCDRRFPGGIDHGPEEFSVRITAV